MKSILKNKSAYYFSLDAFIALVIILGVVLFVKPTINQVSVEEHVHEDLLNVLSSLQMWELNDSAAQAQITDGNVTDLNNTVLEQLGEYYANNDMDSIDDLLDSIMTDLDLNKNIRVDFESDYDYDSAVTPYSEAQSISTTRQIISGVQKGNATKGYSARAYLISSNKVNYFYFGGYVGDGNITVKIDGDVVGARIEGVFGGDFNISINDNPAGSYSPTANEPYPINLASYLDYFNSGTNYINFTSEDDNIYIAGGYLRIVYNTTEISTTNEKRYLPGVEGLINIYDSAYIPSDITGIEAYIHYNSPYDIFMTLGNKTIYEGNSSGVDIGVTLNDTWIKSIFDPSGINPSPYAEILGKTVPFRIGLSNVSYTINISIPSDVYSVTDLSGSMGSCGIYSPPPYLCHYGCRTGTFPSYTYTVEYCTVNDVSACTDDVCGAECSLTYGWSTNATCQETLLDLAKDANNIFIDFVLNNSGNRIGLIGYSNEVSSIDTLALTSNNVSLKNKVNSWTSGGGTCICCGINRAVHDMNIYSTDPDTPKSIVVMSDGAATLYCDNFNDYTGSGSGSTSDPIDKQSAIDAACNAANYNITVYAVGFGDDADITTLQQIGTSCGGGGYFDAQNINQLAEIYQQIAQNIIEAAYVEQTIVADENINTTLYPDSYIHVQYDKNVPYGLLITTESNTFDNSIAQGDFEIPQNTTPIEARVISYSGSKWTSKVELNNSATSGWQEIFNLGDYNLNYTNLGDPYFVTIPAEDIVEGNNSIKVQNGLGPTEISGGSQYDKVIYTVAKEVSSYSPILSIAQGCIWNIEFDDGTTEVISVPLDYAGTDECYYNSTDIIYNPNDAINDAIAKLFADLDLNGNDKIDTKFSENDLQINSIDVAGIPFPWETEVQIRTWR